MVVLRDDVLEETHRQDICEWILTNEHLDKFNTTTTSDDTDRKAFAVTYKSDDLPDMFDFLRAERTSVYNIIGIVTYMSGDIPEHTDDDLVWYMKEIDMPDVYIKPPKTTCVYYANICKTMTGGDTVFSGTDDRHSITVPASQNSMTIFSSNMPHSVTAMKSSCEPRVVLVCERYRILKPGLQYLNTPVYRDG